MAENILIIGQDSQIGSYLKENLKNYNIYGTTRRKENVNANTLFFDLAKTSIDLDVKNFETVIICATSTNIKKFNHAIEKCKQINVNNTIKLIDFLSTQNCFIIFLSTSQVFNGKKAFPSIDSKPEPVSNYGKFKLAVELHIKENINNASVLRMTKVVSEKSPFIKLWNKQYNEGRQIIAFTNNMISPVSEKDVLNSISILIERKLAGIYHLGSSEELSYFDFAKKLFVNDKKKLSKLKPIKDSRFEGDFINHNSLKSSFQIEESYRF